MQSLSGPQAPSRKLVFRSPPQVAIPAEIYDSLVEFLFISVFV